jgi:uncharacterized protein Yka (UPF0111/DUF47 family)
MSKARESLPRRLWQAVFPQVPDFPALVATQASYLEEALAELASFLGENDASRAGEVRQCVARAHELARDNLDLLHRSFITRLDREDIDMLITRVDHVFDYATSSVREIELLDLAADRWMTAMVDRLQKGAGALSEGLARFRKSPSEAGPCAAQVLEAERAVEELYRDALAELFSAAAFRGGDGDRDVDAGVAFILDRMKRREVYRHLSNAADRLADAGEALHDLSVKYA